ncbi:MAG: UDP-N-acetylglucosamine 1-carboxyvinyltransferase [Proteobacteria bacterium]|nr:UDP-N-acetylglucosamine 1-carboxyvinyltransferase [Pseudomonadota bacterium]
MDAFVIRGPSKLRGSVQVSGSKNAALPFIFSALLFDREVHFENVPRLWDIETTLKLLAEMGCIYQWNKDEGKLSVLPQVKTKTASYEWVSKMRAGILALGPLVAKFGEAKVSLPGGCAIGARPVNFHLDALKRLGAKVEVEEGYIKASVGSRLKGAHLVFPEVSVTGTENVLFWGCFAEGETVIENAAMEPEVVALGEFLKSCGANIRGLGTSVIHMTGSPIRTPQKPIQIPSDRIETGTWVSIAMATQSPLTIYNAAGSELGAVLKVYRKMGLGIEEKEGGRILQINPQAHYDAVSVETECFPGFPTDMQAQVLVNMCQAQGVSHMRENIFENRFMHVAELRRLGAKIQIEGNLAKVEGPTVLKGAPMMATDLRASASLVVAGLMAEGTSTISRIYHLDRGYQRLDQKLQSLGAQVTRVAQ